jgi:hypothetical protein
MTMAIKGQPHRGNPLMIFFGHFRSLLKLCCAHDPPRKAPTVSQERPSFDFQNEMESVLLLPALFAPLWERTI